MPLCAIFNYLHTRCNPMAIIAITENIRCHNSQLFGFLLFFLNIIIARIMEKNDSIPNKYAQIAFSPIAFNEQAICIVAKRTVKYPAGLCSFISMASIVFPFNRFVIDFAITAQKHIDAICADKKSIIKITFILPPMPPSCFFVHGKCQHLRGQRPGSKRKSP